MKKRRGNKKVIALVLTLATMIACTTSSFALKLTTSDHFTVRDGTFNVETNLYIDGGTLYRGAIFINTADMKNSPSGTMFAKAQVWDTSGHTVCQSQWDYNYEANYWLGAVMEKGYSSKPVYAGGSVRLGAEQRPFEAPNTDPYPNSRASAAGLTSADGDHSNTELYLNNQAVTARLMSALTADGDYPRAASGETYGSSMLAGIVGKEPDLISAVGVDGIEGFVRPEELCADYGVQPDEIVLIPLYDANGVEISSFALNSMKES
ncbi:MAG: hypothetical protein HFF57_10280 [Lawsonibacter sp.]|jgi:hypothetical protein|nr:hypothetical protein [Lawsonibacter sp.]